MALITTYQNGDGETLMKIPDSFEAWVKTLPLKDRFQMLSLWVELQAKEFNKKAKRGGDA